MCVYVSVYAFVCVCVCVELDGAVQMLVMNYVALEGLCTCVCLFVCVCVCVYVCVRCFADAGYGLCGS